MARFCAGVERGAGQALGDDALLAIDRRGWRDIRAGASGAGTADCERCWQMKRFEEAQQVIAAYQAAFPKDDVFPLKAEALLALQQGDAEAEAQALALFDKAYQPLWAGAGADATMQLLDATHAQHAMLAAARAQLVQNPDDLNAVTRIFYFYQQEGRMDAAANVLAAVWREQRKRGMRRGRRMSCIPLRRCWSAVDSMRRRRGMTMRWR